MGMIRISDPDWDKILNDCLSGWTPEWDILGAEEQWAEDELRHRGTKRKTGPMDEPATPPPKRAKRNTAVKKTGKSLGEASKASSSKTDTGSCLPSRPTPGVRKRKSNHPNGADTPASKKVKLNVYLFGDGANGELGMGSVEDQDKVVGKRPALSPHLLPAAVGVVDVAAGGMHGLALTHDGRVYSWGVNDESALGRNTRGPNSDVLESTPSPVQGFPTGTVITKIAAGDSISVAVSDKGIVYAWGQFRVCL